MFATDKARTAAPSKRVTKAYSAALRKIARAVGHITDIYVDGHTVDPRLYRALADYAKSIEPWAVRTASGMLKQINASNRAYWVQLSRQFGRALRIEMSDAPTGLVARQMVAEQVELILSIPLKSGERTYDLAAAASLASEGMQDGTRAREIAEELARTEDVTLSRAMLIARTETARATAALNAARALSVGSAEYIWRTAEDDDVRESHAEMEGQTVRFDTPPTLSDGTTTHAGMIYNCRCYMEPVLPDVK